MHQHLCTASACRHTSVLVCTQVNHSGVKYLDPATLVDQPVPSGNPNQRQLLWLFYVCVCVCVCVCVRACVCVCVFFLPKRYAHYDNNPSFSDFSPFGGWSKPSIKQYAGDATECGKYWGEGGC